MNLPAKITAPLPPSTPQIAQSLSQQELSAHREGIAYEVRVLLSAYFDPSETEEVKAGLLAWFCDELQDWRRDQVVAGLRMWNRENPRRRPTPGDISGLLKRVRGERLARELAALPKPAEPAIVITEEARQRNLALVEQLGFAVKRVPEVKA